MLHTEMQVVWEFNPGGASYYLCDLREAPYSASVSNWD